MGRLASTASRKSLTSRCCARLARSATPVSLRQISQAELHTPVASTLLCSCWHAAAVAAAAAAATRSAMCMCPACVSRAGTLPCPTRGRTGHARPSYGTAGPRAKLASSSTSAGAVPPASQCAQQCGPAQTILKYGKPVFKQRGVRPVVVVQKCNEERICAALPQKLRTYPTEEALCVNVLRDAALLCSLCRNSDGLLCMHKLGHRRRAAMQGGS